MKPIEIFIASDHRGVVLKQVLINYLSIDYEHRSWFKLTDLGCNTEERVDYPVYAQKLCQQINSQDQLENQQNQQNPDQQEKRGILICNTANGMAIAANRHPGIRAALAFNNKVSELARLHNNANVVCLPAGFLTDPEAIEIVTTFLETEFYGERHRDRINMIDQM